MDLTAQNSSKPAVPPKPTANDLAQSNVPQDTPTSSALVTPSQNDAAGPTSAPAISPILEKKIQEPEQFSGPGKEQLEGGGFGETVPIVEVSEHEKVPEDVQSWVERLQSAEEIKLPEPIVDNGEVLLSDPVTFKEDRIVLPIAQSTVSKGLKSKTTESVRWLAVWCVRLMKMFGGRARYQDG